MALPDALSDGRADAWLLPLSAGATEDYCREVLSAAEWAKAQRFHFPRDRALSLNARAALRSLLGGYLDLPPASLSFEYQTNGRPVLARGLAGEQVRFSVSHAGEMVAIAVSRHSVGIDLEHAVRKVDFESLLKMLPAEEASQVLGQPEAERRTAFLQCWTRKEARLKATGEGLAGSRRSDPTPWRYFDISREGYLGTVATAPECSQCRVGKLAWHTARRQYVLVETYYRNGAAEVL